MSAPPLSDAIAASALDPAARRDLGGLQKDLAETVARHLVAAGTLVDGDPQAALAHARYARRRASRIAIVREAAGIAAYHAGEWAEALAELRAARRMGGGPGHLAVMADIERAVGRPERAIELARDPEARDLSRSAQIELAIVVAGARRDLGELDAAVVALQVPELEASRRDPWSARLFYAYADNLLAAGRESDALLWFTHAADADVDGLTDADVRIAELTGEPLADDGIEFAVDDEYPDDEPAVAEDDDAPPRDDSAIPAPSVTAPEDAATPVTGPVVGWCEGHSRPTCLAESAVRPSRAAPSVSRPEDAAPSVSRPEDAAPSVSRPEDAGPSVTAPEDPATSVTAPEDPATDPASDPAASGEQPVASESADSGEASR